MVWGLEHAFFPTPTLNSWDAELGLGSSCLPYRLKFSEELSPISLLEGPQGVKHTAINQSLVPFKGGERGLRKLILPEHTSFCSSAICLSSEEPFCPPLPSYGGQMSFPIEIGPPTLGVL